MNMNILNLTVNGGNFLEGGGGALDCNYSGTRSFICTLSGSSDPVLIHTDIWYRIIDFSLKLNIIELFTVLLAHAFSLSGPTSRIFNIIISENCL